MQSPAREVVSAGLWIAILGIVDPHLRRRSRTRSCYACSIYVAFARWDPLRDLLAIQHRLERLASSGPQGWVPAVDLCETADAFMLTAELPGLAREQIHIQVNDGRLTLQGRRDARVPLRAVSPGRTRPWRVRAHLCAAAEGRHGRIAADLHDGVLTITMPKTAENGPRRVGVYREQSA